MITNPHSIEVWTEGKTDRKHLKKAAERLEVSVPITFHESDETMGDAKLLKMCETFSTTKQLQPTVFIFDGDINFSKKVNDQEYNYKDWGNNVFSFSLPKPKHREDHVGISIEHYYSDEELRTKDFKDRRLFLTSEFIEKSGRHRWEKSISIGNKHKLSGKTEPNFSKIVESEVFNQEDQNIALSKSDFASNIYYDNSPFDEFDFSSFKQIFEILEDIYKETNKQAFIHVPDLNVFFNDQKGKSIGEQIYASFEMMQNVLSLCLQIFSITVIRVYEDQIVNEPDRYRKKAKEIKKILNDKFPKKPSLDSLYELSKKCYYIIDDRAPEMLIEMKACLDKDFLLGDIGQILDDFEKMFPSKSGIVIQTNKAKITRNLMKFVFPEIILYSKYSRTEIELAARDSYKREIKIGNWFKALQIIVELLAPIWSHTFELRCITKTNPKTGNYIVTTHTYQGNNHYTEEIEILPNEQNEYQTNRTELKIDINQRVHVFPFLVIKDNALFFYRRTLQSGYEYYSLINNQIHTEKTKKRFNHSVFKTGSKQAFFWIDVLPVVNQENGIKANIPGEELEDFVGRSRQLKRIMEEIVEIPNQNGIVYGPGGIGKTALMIQLTRKLYQETATEKIIYNNIVWVSAKSDYYDFVFQTIEKRERPFRSLEEVIQSVLEFFEFENLEEYDFEDKKELLLEVLNEKRIFLIVDNFETFPKNEAEKIIRFFGIEVKKRLRLKPDYFKLIITSRKQIPCGFHQLELKGLDPQESRQLVAKLLKRYDKKSNFFLDDQEQELYQATKGIPIVLKHCLGKMFEYNLPFQTAVRELFNASNEVVKFSFKEILDQIEKKDPDLLQLRIILLLEIINYPLIIRQMADILNENEYVIEKNLPLLMDFQCLSRISQNGYEKYIINDEIRLFTRGMAKKYANLVKEIRSEIATNSIDKQMDYTSEEMGIISLFENYITEKEYIEAEDFMKAQLKDKTQSVFLYYHYANYLVQRRRQYEEAIGILEVIREQSSNHPNVLKLLVSCYVSQSIPNYEKASVYVEELESYKEENRDLQLLIAEFYVKWSTSIKTKQREFHTLEEKIRQNRYKDIALKALDILNNIPNKERTDEIYYLFAQSLFNTWQNQAALNMINKAISLASKKNTDAERSYQRFKNVIEKREERYSGRNWQRD